jgi:integrase/recombinase XerC
MAQVHSNQDSQYTGTRASYNTGVFHSRKAQGVTYQLMPAWQESFEGFVLAEKAAGHDVKSIDNRRSALRALSEWLAEHEGIESPADVTVVHMQRYFMHVYQVRKGSGPRTHYNDLKVFWQCECAKTGQAYPLGSIPRPPDIVTSPAILTGAQLKSVLDACDGRGFLALRDRAIVLMFMDSGMRRSELVALDIADVMPLKANQVVIRRGKGGKPRITTFGPDTALALHTMLRMRPAAESHEPLFTSSNGRRLTASAIGYMLKRRGKQAGVPGLRPHIMRHAWAHSNLADGVAEHDLMTLAGWTTTAQISRYGAALATERALTAGKARSAVRLVMSS